MKKEEAKKIIADISAQLEEHSYKYYVLSQPSISDKEYDDLLKKLISFEKEFPGLKDLNSPSQRIGSEIPAEAKKVKHKAKMYSLDNTYSIDEIKDWNDRVLKDLVGEKIEYTVELKIDGISIALNYVNGILAQGATRGDGVSGEDVTQNVKTIKTIPLKMFSGKSIEIPGVLEVRGEIYMDDNSFAELNSERKENGEVLFANPRNATSGSVKLLDSRITAKRKLKCFIHSFGIIEKGKGFDSQWDFLKAVEQFGFCIDDNSKLCKSIEDVIDYCKEYQEKRAAIPYEVDGVVIKINSLSQQKKLGSTMKSPRWAVAYKFPAQQASTIVNDIVVQVGRTGVLTPVADLEPVECAGVVISRSTLHNFDEVKRLGIRVGDKVLLERAGDVIPKIVKVLESSKGGKQKTFSPPKICPECGAKIEKDKDDDVAYRCNNSQCPRQLERKLVHFASRGAMDIEGLGESVIGQLLESGLVRNIADIYDLKKDELLGLELFADKKAENLLRAIENSKRQPLSRLIFALGIDNVGEKASYTIARKYGSIEKITDAKSQELFEINDIGEVIAMSIENYFSQADTKALIKRFQDNGLNLIEDAVVQADGRLMGKKFIFTGELIEISRRQASDMVRKLGGDVVSSVSSKTDFVVAGGKPGSKYKKAVELGIEIINEKQFREMTNG